MLVGDIDLSRASDDDIFDRASIDAWVVVTADTDFSMLLAFTSTARPSVVLLRQVAELRPDAHFDLLVANLQAVAADLDAGAIVSLSPSRLLSASSHSVAGGSTPTARPRRRNSGLLAGRRIAADRPSWRLSLRPTRSTQRRPGD